MTKHDTPKPDLPDVGKVSWSATSPRFDYVGPIRDIEVDPDNVGEAHTVESQEGDFDENH
jgi:hypothetical protein